MHSSLDTAQVVHYTYRQGTRQPNASNDVFIVVTKLR